MTIGHRYGVVVVSLLFTVLTIPSAHAWTPCDRSFHYHGMATGDTTVISFWETTWGECDQHRLHRVFIAKDGGFVNDSTITASPKKGFIDKLNGSDFDDHLMRLRWKDSVFTGPYTVAPMDTVRPPAFDSAFDRFWRDSLRVASSSGAGTEGFFQDTAWLSQHVNEPTFDKPVELVYRHPRGLYKNYRIIDVLALNGYYFVLTSQPLVTYATFDGVLIYRMKRR